MKGKWAEGIMPRNFTWVIKDRLAMSERLGGYGTSHRKVRRQEEILWVKGQGFSRVISLLPSPHNLHAYEELGLPAQHLPFGPADDPVEVLGRVYPEVRAQLDAGDRLLLHQDELGDRLQGFTAGYLVYAGLVPEASRAISMLELMTQRQLGPMGRELVAVATRMARR